MTTLLIFFVALLLWQLPNASLAADESLEAWLEPLEEGQVPPEGASKALPRYLSNQASRTEWNTKSRMIGRHLYQFLTKLPKVNDESTRAQASQAENLDSAAAFLIAIREFYKTEKRPKSFHEIVMAAQEAANSDEESTAQFELLQALREVRTSPNDDNERMGSLDKVVRLLQTSAVIQSSRDRQTSVETSVGSHRHSPSEFLDPKQLSLFKKLFDSGWEPSPPWTRGALLACILLTILAVLLHLVRIPGLRRRADPDEGRLAKEEIARLKKGLSTTRKKVSDLLSRLAQAERLASDKSDLKKMQQELTSLRQVLTDNQKEIAPSLRERTTGTKTPTSHWQAPSNPTPDTRATPSQTILRRINRVEDFLSDTNKRVDAIKVELSRPPNEANNEHKSDEALIQLERNFLAQLWKQAKSTLSREAAPTDQDQGGPSWSRSLDIVCRDLPRNLLKHPGLKENLERISAPAIRLKHSQAKMNAIRASLLPRPSTEETPQQEGSSERELFRLRDYSLHLFHLLNTEEGRRLREFDLRQWIRQQFREFADQFFREYWEGQFLGRSPDLEDAKRLVEEILVQGGIEVIPTVPGRTRFDRSQHIGRSAESSQHHEDGVIVSVLRVGFRDAKKNQVIQQPEVVVNRR